MSAASVDSMRAATLAALTCMADVVGTRPRKVIPYCLIRMRVAVDPGAPVSPRQPKGLSGSVQLFLDLLLAGC